MRGFSPNAQENSSNSVTIIPNRYCFAKIIECPTGLNSEELRNLAEYSLEELSPFPIDQLAWGFLSVPHHPQMLIYAAFKPRLNADGLAPFPESRYVLPAVATLFPLHLDAPTAFFVHYQDDLTLILADAESPLPNRIESQCILGDFNDLENVQQARQKLLEDIPVSQYYYIDPSIIRMDHTDMYEDGTVGFHFSRYRQDSQESESLGINHNENTACLWEADLRDTTFILNEIRRRKTAHRLWMTLQTAAAAAAVLLTVAIGQSLTAHYIEQRFDTLMAQASKVQSIVAQDSLLSKLQNFATEPLQPFDVLSQLNRFRPVDIYYGSVLSIEGNILEIRGHAPTITRLNRFTETLRNSQLFEYVQAPTYSTRSGRVDFTLEVKYNSPVSDPLALSRNDL